MGTSSSAQITWGSLGPMVAMGFQELLYKAGSAGGNTVQAGVPLTRGQFSTKTSPFSGVP